MVLTRSKALYITAGWALVLTAADARPAIALPPPPAVVAEAHRIAGIMGVTLHQPEPTSSQPSSARHTGHTLWECTWRVPGVNGVGATITVDAQTGLGVAFRDVVAFQAAEFIYETQPPSVTEAAATAIFEQLRQDLALPGGDWRVQRAELLGTGNSPLLPSWWFRLARYEQNRPVALGYFTTVIEAFAGKVTRWSFEDSATLLPPQGPLLTREQAEPYAVAAFLDYAGDQLQPGESTDPVARGGGLWEPLHNETTLSRLTYRFIFRLPEIPALDPEDPPQRSEQEIWVDIDGETGEVLGAANVLAGGGGPAGEVRVSPRVRLRGDLTARRVPEALLAAVAGGRPLPGERPPPGALEFKYRLTEVGELGEPWHRPETEVRFQFEPRRRRLYWQDTEGGWQALRLRKEQAAGLARLLAAQGRKPVGRRD
jgi:hypothetical protein